MRGRTTGRGGRGAASGGTPQPAEGSPATTPASTPGPAARGGTTARATRGASVGRFRPKNVRRDEAERDNIARQEEQKAKEREAAERRARGRSRFRSKRSRGDTMGARGGFGRINAVASGPFSAGLSSAGGITRMGARTGIGGGGLGGSFGGGGGSRGDSKLGIKQGDGSRSRETRINADRLHARAPDEEFDSDDEAMMEALGSKSASSLPMGMYRREHKEEAVVVATTAELEAAENAVGDEEGLFVDNDSDEQPPVSQPAEEGVWGEDESKKKIKIKMDPEMEDAMDIDSVVRSATEESKNRLAEQKSKKPIPQDADDSAKTADMQLLAQELGTFTIDEDGETRTEGPLNKDGRLYLLQLPRTVPPLKPTARVVKSEPGQADLGDLPTASGSEPVDLTQDGGDTKANVTDLLEDDEDDDEGASTSGWPREGGFVGKLIVRKSGRTELDWGGRPFSLGPGIPMNSLTTAVIVEQADDKVAPGAIGGDSVDMGKIMGEFVLAPIWSYAED